MLKASLESKKIADKQAADALKELKQNAVKIAEAQRAARKKLEEADKTKKTGKGKGGRRKKTLRKEKQLKRRTVKNGFMKYKSSK